MSKKIFSLPCTVVVDPIHGFKADDTQAIFAVDVDDALALLALNILIILLKMFFFFVLIWKKKSIYILNNGNGFQVIIN